jgi:NADPH2:quinone reductase
MPGKVWLPVTAQVMITESRGSRMMFLPPVDDPDLQPVAFAEFVGNRRRIAAEHKAAPGRSSMKAAVVTGPNALSVSEVETPKAGAGEVLVRVRAASLNRADLAVLAGHMHGSVGGPGTIIGLDCAGEIADIGSGVTQWRVGDRVMGTVRGGAAEFALADAGRLARVPDTLDFPEAASLILALVTMHDAIVTNGAFKSGQTVLIQGASSGVGLLGLQIAKHLGASRVFGSSTDATRRARLSEFGADVALDTSNAAWVETVLAETGGRGVDLIVDQVSGALVNQSLAAVAICGRIVNVGRLGGAKADFDFDLHALRRIHYIGVTFRTRTADEVRAIFERMQADLGAAIAARTLHLPIDSIVPLAEAASAYARMRANTHFGKIILTP